MQPSLDNGTFPSRSSAHPRLVVVYPAHTDVSTPVHPGFIILPAINQLPGPVRDSADSPATLTTTRLFPFGSSPFAVQLCDMLDDPKPLPTSAGRKRFAPRRFYIIANPNEETADASTSSFNPLPPLPTTPIQHPDKPTPSPPQPSPINTDNLKQKYQPRYNPSDRTLSSPSTPTSSPALESTPPPSTPGQKSIPSIDLAQGSDRDNGQTPLISRTDNFVKKITAPFSHARRKSSGNNVQSAIGSVRAICFDSQRDPPNVCVFSPLLSTTIRPPPKPRNLVHA